MKGFTVIPLVLFVAGCGSGVGLPPPDEQPQDEVLEQPLLEEPEPESPPLDEPQPQSEPEPEATTQIRAGSYIGTVQCHEETTVVGSLTSRNDDPDIATATFDSDGNLLISGAPIRVGDTTTRGFGAHVWSFLYRGITNSSIALILHGETYSEFDCGNTCSFAFDSVCDEVRFCALGTDCADCGPVILRGSFTTTYQGQENGTVHMMRNVSALEEDASLVKISFNCDGILSR